MFPAFDADPADATQMTENVTALHAGAADCADARMLKP